MFLCLIIGGFGAMAKSQSPPSVPNDDKPSISHGAKKAISCAVVPCLALTFDDGPSSTTTPTLLDVLAREHVHATFFVVGMRVHERTSILQRIHAEGHEIGNHSWSHANLTKLNPSQVHAEINTTQTAIMEAGVPAPRLLRPPYGAANAVVEMQGLTIVRWNVDPEDWVVKNPDELAARMVQQAKPGGILLLHDTNPHTVEAIAKALPELKAKYQLVTTSELLGLSSGDQGQYFGR